MKVKKMFAAAVMAFAVVLSVSAAPVKTKNGYKNLKWGCSYKDAKKAGYKMTEIDKTKYPNIYKPFKDGAVIYSVKPEDKEIVDIDFVIFNDKLIAVDEFLKSNYQDSKTIINRYGIGRDSKDGIAATGIAFQDVGDGSLLVMMIDVPGYAAAMKNNSEDTGIVSDLKGLANKLIQEGAAEKTTYAFLALTSDDGNALVENYVTDALTEAMFNTNKIKIVERASIEKILTEQKFQNNALVNESTASEIGNLSGANYVCYGTVKDLGSQLTLNVKVVEVSTAEICAMGRQTVTKDEYLQNVKFEGRAGGETVNTNTTAEEKGTIGQTKAAPKKSEECMWKTYKERNDFDGVTTYGFYLDGSLCGNYYIFVLYDKADVQVKSLVRVGICWRDSDSRYIDIKQENGEVKNIKLNESYREATINGTKFVYARQTTARNLFTILKDNNFLTLRSDNIVEKFQTAGLMDKMGEEGITWEEIDNALKNEEF